MDQIQLAGQDGIPVFSTQALFGDKKEILIRHGEALYRLIITRQGKLILNK